MYRCPDPDRSTPRRPIPQLSSIRTIRWNGWGTYNALTLKVERRVCDGLNFSGNYSWSKSIDDASDPGPTAYEQNLPQDVYNLDAEKALSSYDHRHRFVSSFVYQAPLLGAANRAVSRHLRKLAAGRHCVHSIRSSIHRHKRRRSRQHRRRTCTTSGRTARSEPAAQSTRSSALVRHIRFCSTRAVHVWKCGPQYHVCSRFSEPRHVPSTQLPVERNEARLSSDGKCSIVFNTPHFDIPGRIAFSPNFGRIFSTAEPARQMQFGLKAVF